MTGLLFGHRRRDPLLAPRRDFLARASRRVCVFSLKDNRVSSYAEGYSAENFFFFPSTAHFSLHCSSFRSHASFSCQPSVPIGWPGPTWQSLIGWLRWHFVWILKMLIAGKTRFKARIIKSLNIHPFLCIYIFITITTTVIIM